MGSGRSPAGGGGGASIPPTMSNVPTNAQQLTDAQAAQLRQQQDSMYDANTTAAVKMYISNTDFDNDGHSLSQTMNYLLENGVDLNTANLQAINQQFGLHLNAGDLASMQYTNNYMAKAMHSLGQDVQLKRGAHDDLLRNTFGINDYSTMSVQQLKAALVGKAFQNTSYWSSSYDTSKNPFLGSGSGVSGGREVVYNINTGSNTKMLFGAQKQAEMILNKGTNFRITDVRYTGNTATPRGRGAKPQIEIDIETF